MSKTSQGDEGDSGDLGMRTTNQTGDLSSISRQDRWTPFQRRVYRSCDRSLFGDDKLSVPTEARKKLVGPTGGAGEASGMKPEGKEIMSMWVRHELDLYPVDFER